MSAALPDSVAARWPGSFDQHLAAIVENSDDAIVSKDLEGRILHWNDAATRMYGYTAKEAMGRPIEIVIPDDPKRRQEEFEIRAQNGRGERFGHQGRQMRLIARSRCFCPSLSELNLSRTWAT